MDETGRVKVTKVQSAIIDYLGEIPDARGIAKDRLFALRGLLALGFVEKSRVNQYRYRLTRAGLAVYENPDLLRVVGDAKPTSLPGQFPSRPVDARPARRPLVRSSWPADLRFRDIAKADIARLKARAQPGPAG